MTRNRERRAASPETDFSNRASPGRDCPLCPRLVAYRTQARADHPDWFNGPAPPFGAPDAALLIVGLAPGLQGANRTGRPFTGDYAGELLYSTLSLYGFAQGVYRADPDDGLKLRNCVILNAVRCVPPQNKPLPIEIATCRDFLLAALDEMPNLRATVVLGRVAHESFLRALGLRLAAHPFAHGAQYDLNWRENKKIVLIDSYHCSRYNTNTGVLNEAMFHKIFEQARAIVNG